MKVTDVGVALVALGVVAPAASQEHRIEVEVGGGFHAALQVGDLIEFPSVPTVSVRVVRWANENWGIAGDALAGFGSFDPGDHGVAERRDPAYFQIMARYRSASDEKTVFHAGIGGGVGRVGETSRFDPGILGHAGRRTIWYPHLLAVEALVSQRLTERINIRTGVTMVVPVYVHPVVLAAYKF